MSRLTATSLLIAALCVTISVSQGTGSTCTTSPYLLAYAGQCLSSCPSGTYNSSFTCTPACPFGQGEAYSTCSSCPSNCTFCSMNSPSQCDTCNVGTIWNGTLCLNDNNTNTSMTASFPITHMPMGPAGLYEVYSNSSFNLTVIYANLGGTYSYYLINRTNGSFFSFNVSNIYNLFSNYASGDTQFLWDNPIDFYTSYYMTPYNNVSNETDLPYYSSSPWINWDKTWAAFGSSSYSFYHYAGGNYSCYYDGSQSWSNLAYAVYNQGYYFIDPTSTSLPITFVNCNNQTTTTTINTNVYYQYDSPSGGVVFYNDTVAAFLVDDQIFIQVIGTTNIYMDYNSYPDTTVNIQVLNQTTIFWCSKYNSNINVTFYTVTVGSGNTLTVVPNSVVFPGYYSSYSVPYTFFHGMLWFQDSYANYGVNTTSMQVQTVHGNDGSSYISQPNYVLDNSSSIWFFSGGYWLNTLNGSFWFPLASIDYITNDDNNVWVLYGYGTNTLLQIPLNGTAPFNVTVAGINSTSTTSPTFFNVVQTDVATNALNWTVCTSQVCWVGNGATTTEVTITGGTASDIILVDYTIGVLGVAMENDALVSFTISTGATLNTVNSFVSASSITVQQLDQTHLAVITGNNNYTIYDTSMTNLTEFMVPASIGSVYNNNPFGFGPISANGSGMIVGTFNGGENIALFSTSGCVYNMWPMVYDNVRLQRVNSTTLRAVYNGGMPMTQNSYLSFPDNYYLNSAGCGFTYYTPVNGGNGGNGGNGSNGSSGSNTWMYVIIVLVAVVAGVGCCWYRVRKNKPHLTDFQKNMPNVEMNTAV